MESKRMVSAGDSPGVEELAAKLEKLKRDQLYMREVNAHFQRFATCEGYPGMPESEAAEIDARVWKSDSWEKLPFPGLALFDNRGEIQRIERWLDYKKQPEGCEAARGCQLKTPPHDAAAR